MAIERRVSGSVTMSEKNDSIYALIQSMEFIIIIIESNNRSPGLIHDLIECTR